MIRDIEFRGKRKSVIDGKDGVFVYGLLSRDVNENYNIGKYSLDFNVVYPETVGRFTGLLDKNGVKIFEGDILMVNTGRSEPHYIKRLVEWKAPYFTGFVFDRGVYDPKYHEVIGNIHDNPELLEEAK